MPTASRMAATIADWAMNVDATFSLALRGFACGAASVDVGERSGGLAVLS